MISVRHCRPLKRYGIVFYLHLFNKMPLIIPTPVKIQIFPAWPKFRICMFVPPFFVLKIIMVSFVKLKKGELHSAKAET